jgi:ribosomal-protein-alanine N-acetyltransferase
MAIEEASFPSPWARAAMSEELRREHGALYLAAELAGELVGYAGMWVFAGEAHIMNIAVDAPHRRQGIGEALLIVLLQRSVALDARMAYLECRPSNRQAIALYQKLGFHPYGRRPNYYRDTNEDALLLARDDLERMDFAACWEEWERRYDSAKCEVMNDE